MTDADVDVHASLTERAADLRQEADALEKLSALIATIEETGATVTDCDRNGPDDTQLHATLGVTIPVGPDDDDTPAAVSANLHDFEEPATPEIDDVPDTHADQADGADDADTEPSAASDDAVEAAIEPVPDPTTDDTDEADDTDDVDDVGDTADSSGIDYADATADEIRAAIADHVGADYDSGEFTLTPARTILAALTDTPDDHYDDHSGSDLKPVFADVLGVELACEDAGAFYLTRAEVEAVHRHLVDESSETTDEATTAPASTESEPDDVEDDAAAGDDAASSVPERTVSTEIDYERLAAVDPNAPADTDAFQRRADAVVDAFREKTAPNDFTYVRTESVAEEADVEADSTELLLELFADAGGVAEFDVERFGKTNDKTRWRIKRHDPNDEAAESGADEAEDAFQVGDKVPDDAASEEDARADGGTATESALPYAFPSGVTPMAVRDQISEYTHLKDFASDLGMEHGRLRANLVSMGLYSEVTEGTSRGGS